MRLQGDHIGEREIASRRVLTDILFRKRPKKIISYKLHVNNSKKLAAPFGVVEWGVVGTSVPPTIPGSRVGISQTESRPCCL